MCLMIKSNHFGDGDGDGTVSADQLDSSFDYVVARLSCVIRS